jgi:hypothetical protein
MITTSEVAVTATIWALTAAGGFFGIKAALRRKKSKCDGKNKCSDKPTV